MELVELRDGKVARTIAYANAAEFATAFGIGAEPPQGADAKKPDAKKAP